MLGYDLKAHGIIHSNEHEKAHHYKAQPIENSELYHCVIMEKESKLSPLGSLRSIFCDFSIVAPQSETM